MLFSSRAEPHRRAPAFVATFLRYSFVRGLCSRGYWLVASLYLVVDAGLAPSELILVGTGQALMVLVAEVPAGVFADTVSRKWSIVVGHLISAAGMVMVGLVRSFPAVAVSQALWGLGWAFVSGADVAWFSDELDRPDLIDRLLAARARWELTGAAAGLLLLGGVAALAGLATAVVVSGLGVTAVGVVVALRFPERRFQPSAVRRRWAQARKIMGRGVRLARGDRVILAVVVAWFLVNGSGEGYGRLVDKRLLTVGFAGGAHAVVWFAALGLTTLTLAAVMLGAVETRIHVPGVARRTYTCCCGLGVIGMVLFACAADARYAVAAVLVTSGVASPGAVVRAVGEIWVNRRTTSDVRATVHSLLSQAEHLGEFTCGLALAALAGALSVVGSLTTSAILLTAATIVVGLADGPRHGHHRVIPHGP